MIASEHTFYDKKITDSFVIDDLEVLTDSGFVDIKYLHQTVKYDVWRLTTKSGIQLDCADNHILFRENNEEVFVCDLSVGDKIIGENGIEEVKSINILDYDEIMFDLELDENSDRRYYTNGLLSHNTQLAKVLAEHLFDSSDSLIRIDMSEFMEKFATSRLVGAPPGYVGHDEGGQLTEKVRRRPYSVILLDEIEKAHPEVFNILLQVLDDGQLTDSMGRKVDFKNTIIIMTSNTGSRQLKDFGTGIGFATKSKESNRDNDSKEVIEKELKKTFAPEFLNRIDEVITFNSLSKEDIQKIINIELTKMTERIKALDFDFDLSQAAKDHVSDKGYDVEYGARPLKRAIQKYIEDPITEEIIKSNPAKDSKILLDYDKQKDEMVVKIKKSKSKK
jgi:hypothetical protein